METHQLPQPVVAEGALARLQSVLATLPEAEQRVARFIAQHPDETVRLSVKELSAAIGVSEATIIRTCQSIGYRGLRELKFVLAAETVTPLQIGHEDIDPTDSMLTIARKVLQADIQAIADTVAVLDGAALERAVSALLAAPRIEFYGVGSSQPIVVDAYYRFLRMGFNVVAVTDPYMQLVSAAALPPGAVAFGVSHSGLSPETVNALRTAREAGAVTILLSSHVNTPVAAHADIALVTADRAIARHTESVARRIAHLSLIDALCVALALRRPDETSAALARTRAAVSRSMR